jgi:hypothetical protein
MQQKNLAIVDLLKIPICENSVLLGNEVENN